MPHFDCVVMNPPYSGSLHLKFLEKVIEISDEVVSIQPVRWLQDSLAEYKNSTDIKKYKSSIAEHIKDIETFTADESTRYFGAEFIGSVGIYTCDNNKHDYYEHIPFIKNGVDYSFVKRITEQITKEDNYRKMKVVKWNEKLTNFIPLNRMTGENLNRCKPTNVIKEWTKPYKNALDYKYDKEHKSGVARGKIENDYCLVFDTYNEAKNCFDSFTKSDFTRFYMSFVTIDIHIHHNYMPFMSDYKQPWTDERFYKHFNITKDEQQIIKEYARNIWNRINKEYKNASYKDNP